MTTKPNFSDYILGNSEPYASQYPQIICEGDVTHSYVVYRIAECISKTGPIGDLHRQIQHCSLGVHGSTWPEIQLLIYHEFYQDNQRMKFESIPIQLKLTSSEPIRDDQDGTDTAYYLEGIIQELTTTNHGLTNTTLLTAGAYVSMIAGLELDKGFINCIIPNCDNIAVISKANRELLQLYINTAPRLESCFVCVQNAEIKARLDTEQRLYQPHYMRTAENIAGAK